MLFGWMKSLIIYLIFAGVIINLSSSGSYKKYIKFYTGVVAIIILIKPISYIFNFDEKALYGALMEIDSLGNYYEELPSGDKIADYYDMSLSQGIKLELQHRGYMVEEVSVTTDRDDKLVGCRVYIDKASELDKSFEENNIKIYINEVYNLNVDNIYVVRR
ncbi:MAG: stage III sporulation protein AF [Lachnospiraceae bacterium]|nr:stage III sporulation protein AF [Lachnospiraceae bacterium]